MARLTETERVQLKRSTAVREAPPLPPVRPARDYGAFASFASRLARVAKPKPITGGLHWKL